MEGQMNRRAKEILRILTKAGYEAYVVGGYVRDFLLTGETKEIDFCTNATPQQIAEIFTTINSPGLKYGTTIIIYRGHKYEITTYRKELHYLKHRSPATVEYIDHIDKDLVRRDFTINAMCMDVNGRILDPLHGQADLEAGIIRAIGDADLKINNDSLRILRAVRFATLLNFHLDIKLELAIIKYKDNLKKISFEVKKHELDRILLSPEKLRGLKLIKKLNLAEALNIYLPDKIINTDLLGMYAQLQMDVYYPLSKHEKEMVTIINNIVNKGQITKMDILEHGIYLVKIAAAIMQLNGGLVDEMYQELPIYAPDEIHITGDDITQLLNIPPGPVVKKIKDDVIKQIVYHDLTNHKKVIKNYILKNKSKWYNELGDS